MIADGRYELCAMLDSSTTLAYDMMCILAKIGCDLMLLGPPRNRRSPAKQLSVERRPFVCALLPGLVLSDFTL